MKRLLPVIIAAFLFSVGALAQETGVEVDYNNPQKYIVGGVDVEGNHYFSASQIISLTGLQEGMEVTIPGEDMSNIVRRLWLQRYFEDVAVSLDSLSTTKDTALEMLVAMAAPATSSPKVWINSGSSATLTMQPETMPNIL